jgi:hypothetical protein
MDLIGDVTKALVTRGDGLPSRLESSSLQRVLDDRMTLSESIEATTRIIDAYPNGGRAAGEGYIGALAAMLASYPRCVALRCSDRVDGIVRVCKFLPTPADVVAWCEKATEPLRDNREREMRVTRQLADRADHERRETEDRPHRLTVDELKAKYGDWRLDDGRRRTQDSVRNIEASELAVTPYLEAILRRREAAE